MSPDLIPIVAFVACCGALACLVDHFFTKAPITEGSKDMAVSDTLFEAETGIAAYLADGHYPVGAPSLWFDNLPSATWLSRLLFRSQSRCR